MSSLPRPLHERLDTLRTAFASKLSLKLSVLAEFAEQARIASDDTPRQDALVSLRMAAHKLSGSAGTFGYSELAKSAKGLENAVGFLLDQSAMPSVADCEDLPVFLDALNNARLRDDEALAVQAHRPAVSVAISPDSEAVNPTTTSKIVYVVEDDEDQARHLSTVLANFGFEATWLDTPSALEAALSKAAPAAVIMDIMFPGAPESGIDAVLACRDKGLLSCPVIFVSSRDDFKARLGAIRAGGGGYLVKPVDPVHISNTLIKLTTTENEEPFRALIIDDDEDLVLYYASILESANIEVRPLSKPEQALDILTDFRPDVVVTDIRMPECGGFELAELIHQHPDFVHTPIIFVSAEDHSVARVMSMRFGGNDFLSKPVQPDLLLSSVVARAERARLISSVTSLEKVRLADEGFRAMFEASPALIAISDPFTGVHYDVNDTWLSTLGYKRSEVVGKTAVEINMWANLESRKNIVASVAAQGAIRNVVGQLRAKDGRILHVLISGERISVGGKSRYLWVAQDITARKREEEELERRVATATERAEEQAHYLGAVIENTAEGIISIDSRGTIQTFNQAASTIFGYTAEEMIGKDVAFLLPPEERADHRSYVQGSSLYESRIINKARDLVGVHKDGHRFPLELNVSPMSIGSNKMFVGILHDITERKKAEEAREEAQQRAEEANRAKSEFLSSMSHELRTPLNAILGFGQLLQTDPSAPLSNDQAEAIDHIMQSGQHLLGLINEVLELARIETGKLSLAIEDVDPILILEECTALIETRTIDNDITLTNATKGQSLPLLRTDATRFRQILLNLLSNAVKYNRPGGTVTVSVNIDEPGKAQFIVNDTGYGISTDQQAHLFEPFNRLGREDDAIEGTGIGLAITKKLVEALNGTLGFESIEGEGTTFCFSLPYDDDTNAISRSTTKDTASPDVAPPEKVVPINARDSTEKTILYVEDNPANLHLMHRLIERINAVTLIEAGTAEEGLDLIRAQRPDLILMDISLPGMSGFEAMDIIRQDPDLAEIPVIALSANAMQKDIEAGMAAGFRQYLTKPIDMNATLNAIQKALSELEN